MSGAPADAVSRGEQKASDPQRSEERERNATPEIEQQIRSDFPRLQERSSQSWSRCRNEGRGGRV